jgi:hypothetical protein
MVFLNNQESFVSVKSIFVSTSKTIVVYFVDYMAASKGSPASIWRCS